MLLQKLGPLFSCCMLGVRNNCSVIKDFLITYLEILVKFKCFFFFISKEIKFRKCDVLEEKVSEILSSSPNSVKTGL